MKIDISGYREGEYFLEISEKSESISLESLVVKSEVNVNLRLFKTSNSIVVRVEANCVVEFDCDLCLEKFPYDLNTEFDILYKYVFDKYTNDDESDEDNVFFITPDTKYLDITEILRDNLLLSVPMKKVPEEKDGNCVFCGMNTDEILKNYKEENVSPIWEKLNKLKNNN